MLLCRRVSCSAGCSASGTTEVRASLAPEDFSNFWLPLRMRRTPGRKIICGVPYADSRTRRKEKPPQFGNCVLEMGKFHCEIHRGEGGCYRGMEIGGRGKTLSGSWRSLWSEKVRMEGGMRMREKMD